MHREYGPVVRIAPDELSYTTGTAWKKIYGQKHPEFSKCLDGRGIAPASRNGMRGIVTEDQERHGMLRRAILPAFSDRALREQEHYLQTYAAKLVNQLRAAEGVQNMFKWYALTTFDIISELAFGEPGTCLDNAEQPWLSVISSRAKGIVWYELAIYYGLYRLITWIAPGRTVKPREKHMQLCAAKLKKRLGKKGELTDFMSYILDNRNDKLSNLDLVFMTSAFIVAGSGTSASALSGTTFFLLRNPKAYERLVAEVRNAFKKDEEVTIASTSELAFLRACIEEGLRMFPPAPSTLPRFVPKSGEFIDGRWINGRVRMMNKRTVYYSCSQNHPGCSRCSSTFLGSHGVQLPPGDGISTRAVAPTA
jgi:cytochrome P450